MKNQRSQKKFDFHQLFSDVAAHAIDLGEGPLDGLPCLAVEYAQWEAEKNLLRYTAGSLETKYAKKMRSILMTQGRLDLEVPLQTFMKNLVEEGVEAAWDKWAYTVTKDDDSNLRYFLKKSKHTLTI